MNSTDYPYIVQVPTLRGAPSNSTEVCDTKYALGTTTNLLSHLVMYLGEETKVTGLQSIPGGYSG